MLAQKAIAAVVLPTALATMLLGFSSLYPSNGAQAFGSTPTPTPTPSVSASARTTIGASTDTLPYCNWYITGLPANIPLTGSSSTYKGDQVTLSGSATNTSVFVSGRNSIATTADNCSWYGDTNKLASTLTMSASQSKFTATPETNDATDHTMDITLDSTNKLVITLTKTSNCTANNFTTLTDASVYSSNLNGTPVSSPVTKTLIDTMDNCTWSTAYSVKIPAGLKPKYGGDVYTFVGPTLTTILSVTDAQ